MDSKFLHDLCEVKLISKFVSVNEFLDVSDKFEATICKAPTSDNWIKRSMNKDLQNTFLNYANTAYPILHESVLFLCNDFLQIKRINGTELEKAFYNSMTAIDLIDRLIKKVNTLCSKYIKIIFSSLITFYVLEAFSFYE